MGYGKPRLGDEIHKLPRHVLNGLNPVMDKEDLPSPLQFRINRAFDRPLIVWE
jgi:hypothetical protein